MLMPSLCLQASRVSFSENAGRIKVSCLRMALGVLLIALFSGSALGQTREKDKERPKKDGVNSQELETRVTKAEESLLREYKEVAEEYYKQGDKEQAMTVLQRITAINPQMEDVKKQIETINEELLQENGIKSELDVSKSWVAVCEVSEGKPFRLVVSGDYKMDLTTLVPLSGLSTTDPAKDHVASAPFGSVIGLVVTDGKPGDPFAVNASGEYTPKKSGQLFLRVNVPVIAKCKGDLKLQLSGGVEPIPRKR